MRTRGRVVSTWFTSSPLAAGRAHLRQRDPSRIAPELPRVGERFPAPRSVFLRERAGRRPLTRQTARASTAISYRESESRHRRRSEQLAEPPCAAPGRRARSALPKNADMAELADARGSGPRDRKVMGVQVPPSALSSGAPIPPQTGDGK